MMAKPKNNRLDLAFEHCIAQTALSAKA